MSVCMFSLICEYHSKVTNTRETKIPRLHWLTLRRLLSLRETEASFHIVGIEPAFKRLSVPLIWTACVKQSLVKCSEHTPNDPFGLKFFLCCSTNLFHLTRSLKDLGDSCIEIPNSLLETRSQSCTTQRLGGIL